MAASKRQTTFAKIAREQALKERRARKQEKKEDRKRAAAERSADPGLDGAPAEDAVVDDARDD